MRTLIILITFFSLFACKKEAENTTYTKVSKRKVSKNISYKQHSKRIKESSSKNFFLSNDIQFINDSILKGKFKLDISKYELENLEKNCNIPDTIEKYVFNEVHNEGFNYLGDLNGDKKREAVFVLSPLNLCEEGDSYYFTDNKIPRIKTDSGCCHPKNIINIGDIDEDGNMEIAEYYSSCASRYKAITIYSLKNSKWNEIKSFSFVLNDKYSIEKDFKRLFKKTSKNHLEYYEISDIISGNQLVASWEKVKI